MYVLTGTSGTGKTALLQALVKRGFQGYSEPAREILEHQLAIDGPTLPAKNADLFVSEMLKKSLNDHAQTSRIDTVAFFDRGIPDLVAYAHRFRIDAKVFEAEALRTRYSDQVFVLPPWDDIFEIDEFRKATFTEYKEFQQAIRKAYTDAGYALIEVPKTSVDLRADFIEAVLEDTKK